MGVTYAPDPNPKETAPLMPVLHCDDCGSTHLGAPCGMTFAQRMRSVRLDYSWMPAKDLNNYYDEELVTDLFGGKDAGERHEQMMEETEGRGFIEGRDIRSDEDAAFYMDGPECDDVV